LSKLLERRILEQLASRVVNPHCQIPQSTIVSDLDSLDLKEVREREKMREAAEKDRETLREKLIILYV
jgi:hypothetical protein